MSDGDCSLAGAMDELSVREIGYRQAADAVIKHHYLHRKCPISFAFGLFMGPKLLGVVSFGTPPSRHLQISACPSDPSLVVELNRLWVDDECGRNTESWFVSRALHMMPPRIVVSYADPKFGHYGYVYRALNFNYAGWTDMERNTPRFDYIPIDPSKHTREAFRSGVAYRVRRVPKVKYWIATGTRSDRRRLSSLCGWQSLNWKELPPPVHSVAQVSDG